MTEKKIRRQDKWNESHGLVCKTYKLQKDIVERFNAACEMIGKSKKSQLEILMLDFCQQVESQEFQKDK